MRWTFPYLSPNYLLLIHSSLSKNREEKSNLMNLNNKQNNNRKRKQKKWICVTSKKENPRLLYSRFMLSGLKKGQAQTIGIALRRALLGEIEGISITRAIFHNNKASHEYGQIDGVDETLYEILQNLQKIVLRSPNNRHSIKASICVSGPRRVTANDICVSPSVTIVDTTQYIATLTKAIDFSIDLEIERGRGYRCIKDENNPQDGAYSIDAVFMPVINVNLNIYDIIPTKQEETLFIEVLTNGSVTPQEAFREASNYLKKLFGSFLDPKEKDIFLEETRDISLNTYLKRARWIQLYHNFV